MHHRGKQSWSEGTHQASALAGSRGFAGVRSAMGFTLAELVLALALIGVMTAMSLPLIQGALTTYHLKVAVPDVQGAIQTTRYQAIMTGCPYTIAFSQTTATYQVQEEALSGNPPACAASFSDVGGLVPWSTTGDVTMSPSTTLQFSPNGTVTATTGSLTFSLTNGVSTETMTVSGVGNVTASP